MSDYETEIETEPTEEFCIPCTGDVVKDDKIRFTEGVFRGSRKNPERLGDRTVEAIVLRDSYGAVKQQHTFTLKVLKSEGCQPLAKDRNVWRKGRNIYRFGTFRKAWKSESCRSPALAEKHDRGDKARAVRDARRERGPDDGNP